MSTEVVVADDFGLQNNRLKVDTEGKPLFIKVINWRTVKDIHNVTKQEFINWTADVVAHGNSKDNLTLNTDGLYSFANGHVDFRLKINELLKGKDRAKVLFLKIKITDKKVKPMVYDIEFVE